MIYSRLAAVTSDKLSIYLMAFGVVCGLAMPTRSMGFEASYDPSTGAVWFHDVENLVAARINSSAQNLIRGGMGNLNGAAAGTLAVVSDQAPEFMEWGNLRGMTFNDGFAGYLFPAGLTLSEIVGSTELLFRTLSEPANDIYGTWTHRDQPANPPDNRPVDFAPRELAQKPRAEYDPRTGQVTFKDLDRVVGLRLTSTSNLLIPTRATTLNDSVSGIFGLNAEGPEVIEWTNYAGISTLQSGVRQAGEILPPGLTIEELTSEIAFDVRSGNEPDYDLTGQWEIPALIGKGTPTITMPKTNDEPYAAYDPSTGGITFFNVNDLAGLRFESSGELLIPEQAQSFTICPSVLGACGVNDQAPALIEWGSLIGISQEEKFIGNIMPAAMTQREVAEDIRFVYRTLDDPLTDLPGAFLVTIPEPKSLVLVALAGSFMTIRRSS